MSARNGGRAKTHLERRQNPRVARPVSRLQTSAQDTEALATQGHITTAAGSNAEDTRKRGEWAQTPAVGLRARTVPNARSRMLTVSHVAECQVSQTDAEASGSAVWTHSKQSI